MKPIPPLLHVLVGLSFQFLAIYAFVLYSIATTPGLHLSPLYLYVAPILISLSGALLIGRLPGARWPILIAGLIGMVFVFENTTNDICRLSASLLEKGLLLWPALRESVFKYLRHLHHNLFFIFFVPNLLLIALGTARTLLDRRR